MPASGGPLGGTKKPESPKANAAPPRKGKLGYKEEIGLEGNLGRRIEMLNELMAQFGAYDALNSSLQARQDPTIPALINSQLQNYAQQMSAGPQNVNGMLGGNFASSAQGVPVTFGQNTGGPFDLGMQKGGVDPAIMSLYQNLVKPSALEQMNNSAQLLYEFGNPNGLWHTQGPLAGPTGTPLPYWQDPTWGQPPPTPAPTMPQPPMQVSPITSLPTPGPIAPASAPVQPPPAQQPGQPVPQFAQGTPYVPQTGLAVVHQGEQITPAQQNPNGNVFDSSHIRAFGQTPQMQPNPAAAPPPAAPIPGGTPHLQGQVPPPAPPTYGGQANPLQQSINQLSQMLASGGPFNQQFQNIQNQQMADTTGAAYQQQRQDMLSRLGARGLGGSGIQYGVENDLFNGQQAALTQGLNQNAINAAGGNWNALQSGAGNLMNASLGAGQFGLAQQAQQQGQQMSMFQMLLDALRKSQVSPNELYGQQVTISPTA